MKRWTWHEDGMYPEIDRRVEKLDLCDDEDVLWCKYSEVEAEIRKLWKMLEDTNNVLQEAQEHLEYCNYGDEWERECADSGGLSDRINNAVITAREALEREKKNDN